MKSYNTCSHTGNAYLNGKNESLKICSFSKALHVQRSAHTHASYPDTWDFKVSSQGERAGSAARRAGGPHGESLPGRATPRRPFHPEPRRAFPRRSFAAPAHPPGTPGGGGAGPGTKPGSVPPSPLRPAIPGRTGARPALPSPTAGLLRRPPSATGRRLPGPAAAGDDRSQSDECGRGAGGAQRRRLLSARPAGTVTVSPPPLGLQGAADRAWR